MKGYKAFKKDSKGIYTDGMGSGTKVYWKKGDRKKLSGKLKLCNNGFHFFFDLCFAINYLNTDNVIYEIAAHGDIVKDTYKACTNDIEIVKRVTKSELNKIIDNKSNSGDYNSGGYNSGDYNSGGYNSGDYNSGSYNSGSYNSGVYNSGVYNSGSHNSGNYNSGGYNSGNHNSGSYNSGSHNSGDYNSGDYNSGSCNSGVYNSGDYNSGSHNSGSCNLGSHNSGSYNSGSHNSGDYNSGGYNSGSRNSGNYNISNGYINYFCTHTSFFLFDKKVDKIPKKLLTLDMSWFDLLKAEGDYKTAWSKCPKEVLDILRSIEEFQKPRNRRKFKRITGITL